MKKSTFFVLLVLAVSVMLNIYFAYKLTSSNGVMEYRVEQALLNKGYYNPKFVSSERSKVFSQRGHGAESKYYVVIATKRVAPRDYEEQKLLIWCPRLSNSRVIVADENKNEI
jgi:hypothetical protein